MPDKITESQYDDLVFAMNTSPKEFIELMEEYTGITAKQYTAYQFFDSADNYIGDYGCSSLSEILEDAGIEVVADD